MSWYLVVEAEWPETRRALWRFALRAMGSSATPAEFAAGTVAVEFRADSGAPVLPPIAVRPMPIYRNPQTGVRYVRLTHRMERWIDGATTIGGDRVRLGTRVNEAQLPQWLQTRLERGDEGESA